MNNIVDINEFIDSPNTVNFIAQNSENFIEYIKDKPYIIPATFLTGGYLVAYVDRSFIDKIMVDLGSYFISSESFVCGLLGRQELEASGIIQVQEQPFLDLRGQGVLIGIIDTGIDYTLDIFKYEDGTTKIKAIYDQTVRGTVPYNLSAGTEYTQEQINEALQSSDPFSIVPQNDTVGHGTFLASVAAGRESGNFIGAAPDAELLVVKLKQARPYYREKYLVPPEQENVYESSAVMVGVEYILKKSQELGRPVVICIGVGTNKGGHDGFSIFEEYLSKISNNTGVCVCTAAGNESQARHHTMGVILKEDEVQNIELRIGENATGVYVCIWNNAPDRMSISVRSPTGEVIGRVPAKSGSRYEAKLVLEKSAVVIEYYFPTRGSGGQQSEVKLINATPGIWTIMVHGDLILSGEYHAWLPIIGLVSPSVEFLLPNPNYTIVVPSTAIGPITCGGYNSRDNSLYTQTSWGPTRLPAMSPDFVAPAVDVVGYFPGGLGTMSGTSAATAITAGAAALMMQWGVVERNDIAMSTYQIRAYLIRGASRSEGIVYPNTQWGYGKLNLFQSFNLMREI